MYCLHIEFIMCLNFLLNLLIPICFSQDDEEKPKKGPQSTSDSLTNPEAKADDEPKSSSNDTLDGLRNPKAKSDEEPKSNLDDAEEGWKKPEDKPEKEPGLIEPETKPEDGDVDQQENPGTLKVIILSEKKQPLIITRIY